MTPILLIESVSALATVYRGILERAGNSVVTAATLAEGMQLFHQRKPCVTLLDGLLVPGDLDDTLRRFKAARPDSRILLTLPETVLGHQGRAFESRAFDVLVKPFEGMRLLNAVAEARTDILSTRLSRTTQDLSAFPLALAGDSAAVLKVHERLAAFAQSAAPVLITGPQGSGKSDCARALHARRKCRGGALRHLYATTVTVEQLDDAIGPHRKEDTVLIHRIDKLSGKVAARLLAALQDGASARLHFISTLEGSVQQALHERVLDAELLHRLNALPLALPALQARGADIIEIAHRALPELCRAEGKPEMTLHEGAETALLARAWPGGVPELVNLLRQVVVLSNGGTIDAHQITSAGDPGSEPYANGAQIAVNAGKTLAEIERDVIEQTIAAHQGSIPKAAKVLGVSPSTIYRKREAWTAA